LVRRLDRGLSVRLAAAQSNYIPWKGYFDLINQVDEFVFLDEVQYTRRDWRNRNKIKVGGVVQWLTIPVEAKGRYHQRIDETRIADSSWAERHFDTLVHAYRRAPHFDEVAALLEPLYRRHADTELLTEVNTGFVAAICGELGIGTRLSRSTEYPTGDERSLRLVDLCRAAGADEYLSGPAARDYLDVEAFAQAGVRVRWADYSGYPEYPQLGGEFEHGVSIVDLLFNTGAAAPDHMKSFGTTSHAVG
jgi:WbqC-like protein family